MSDYLYRLDVSENADRDLMSGWAKAKFEESDELDTEWAEIEWILIEGVSYDGVPWGTSHLIPFYTQLSNEFPDVFMILDQFGVYETEDEEPLKKVYIKNGQVQVAKAQVTFDEPDERFTLGVEE